MNQTDTALTIPPQSTQTAEETQDRESGKAAINALKARMDRLAEAFANGSSSQELLALYHEAVNPQSVAGIQAAISAVTVHEQEALRANAILAQQKAYVAEREVRLANSRIEMHGGNGVTVHQSPQQKPLG